MHIGLIDTSLVGSRGSMARYRDQLVRALADYQGQSVQTSVLSLGPSSQQLRRVPRPLRSILRHGFTWNAARKIDPSEFDLLHLLDGSFGYVASALRTQRYVTTVHDLIPRLQTQGTFAKAPRVGRFASAIVNRSLRGVAGARAICCDSHCTAADLMGTQFVSDDQVSVVHLGLTDGLTKDEIQSDRSFASRPEDGVSDPVILHVGNNGFYKNRLGVIEVFERIAAVRKAQLVLAGELPSTAILDRVASSAFSKQIQVRSDLTDGQLYKLYRSSALLLFPSWYEGFGWPPLEAMTVGCPVVCSSAGSLAEIVGDAAAISHPGDTVGLANHCLRLLGDIPYRERMIQRGFTQSAQFSWEKTAQEMARFYARALFENQASVENHPGGEHGRKVSANRYSASQVSKQPRRQRSLR
ncbi:MAG: hypothetical protein CBB71_22855 [Rhodopirellula sp. TMED11]|nr:MAG: hypothetical protein CBB71_22855 [Rhodopirellula sp. TMED11]